MFAGSGLSVASFSAGSADSVSVFEAGSAAFASGVVFDSAGVTAVLSASFFDASAVWDAFCAFESSVIMTGVMTAGLTIAGCILTVDISAASVTPAGVRAKQASAAAQQSFFHIEVILSPKQIL